ncbi:hypothetical protein D3C73_1090270 [compost metagenome]
MDALMNPEQIGEDILRLPQTVSASIKQLAAASFEDIDREVRLRQIESAYKNGRRLLNLQQGEQETGALAFFLFPLEPPFMLQRMQYLEELLLVDRFEEIIDRRAADGFPGIVEFDEPAHQQRADLRVADLEPLDQLQTVHLRHADIGNDYIQPERRQLIEQLLAVAIGSDHAKGTALLADHPGQAFTDQNLIIYNHNTQQSGYPLSWLYKLTLVFSSRRSTRTAGNVWTSGRYRSYSSILPLRRCLLLTESLVQLI